MKQLGGYSQMTSSRTVPSPFAMLQALKLGKVNSID
jgi:hypothetical protein